MLEQEGAEPPGPEGQTYNAGPLPRRTTRPQALSINPFLQPFRCRTLQAPAVNQSEMP